MRMSRPVVFLVETWERKRRLRSIFREYVANEEL
jgi:hypothetical protein